MEEIFKISTICFTDEKEYEDFKESCLPRSKNFCGWEIIKGYNKTFFNPSSSSIKNLHTSNKFKITFEMLKI